MTTGPGLWKYRSQDFLRGLAREFLQWSHRGSMCQVAKSHSLSLFSLLRRARGESEHDQSDNVMIKSH